MLLSYHHFMDFCLIFIFNVWWAISRDFEGIFHMNDIFACSDIISTRNTLNEETKPNQTEIFTHVSIDYEYFFQEST